MADVDLPANANVATVIIAHGNGSGRFTKAHEELKEFVKVLIQINQYTREHYMV